MAVADWTLSRFSNGGAYGTIINMSQPTVVASGGGTRSLEAQFASGDTSYEIYQYRYTGAEVGNLPSKYLRMSMALRGEGQIATNNWGYGMFFSKESPVGDYNSQSFWPLVSYAGFYQESTTGGTDPTLYIGSNIYGGGTTGIQIPRVDNGFVQYEIALLVNDISILDPVNGLEQLYYVRWNTGSSLSTPGSAGWTSWTLAKEQYLSTYNAQRQPLTGGWEPGFGWYFNGTSFSGGAGDRLLFDQIEINYGTLTP
jgi:hypothetical protein